MFTEVVGFIRLLVGNPENRHISIQITRIGAVCALGSA
jgi:hypothetical protein